MSYILEALKKSDAERKRGDVPTLDGAPQPAPIGMEHGKSPAPWILSGVLGLVVIGLAGVLILRPDLVTLDAPVTARSPKPQPVAPPAPSPAAQAVAQAKPQPVAEPMPAPEPEAAPEATPEPPAMPALEAMPEQIAEPSPRQMVDQTAEPEPAPLPEPMPEAKSAVEPQLEPVLEATAAPEPVPAPAPVTIYTPRPAPPSPTAAKAAPEADAEHAEAVAPPAPTPAPAAKPRKPSLITASKAPPKSAPKAGRTAQHNAKTYVDDAWASIDKGFYNQALRDLNRAVEIEPGYADAWFARGWTNEKSGNELSAIGDYGRAIAAKPDHAFALFSRGYLNLYVGSAQGAVTDFVRTQGVAQDPSLKLYSHLWLYLSRTRAGQDALMRLVEDTAQENLNPWPGPLVRHVLGQIEEGRVIAAMDAPNQDGGDAASRLERRCTGYFFLGISALHKGEPQRARTYFEKALATGAVQFRQYDAAKRELDKLNR